MVEEYQCILAVGELHYLVEPLKVEPAQGEYYHAVESITVGELYRT